MKTMCINTDVHQRASTVSRVEEAGRSTERRAKSEIGTEHAHVANDSARDDLANLVH